MTLTPEAVNAYFTPLDYFFYLAGIFVAMIIYYQWKWSRTSKTKVLVLIQKADGHGDYELADQAGGSVSLKNPKSNTTRLWPINELATIDVPYPGVGFVPDFLQKSIRMVIVDEQDWEPLTNRSPHRPKVASPDVVADLVEIGENTTDQKVKKEIENIVRNVSTGPTREMIASPALLGNTVLEKVSEVAVTVVKDMMDPISSVIKRLNKLVSPTMFYIGIGAILIGLVFLGYQIIPAVEQIDNIYNELNLIKQSLGVTP